MTIPTTLFPDSKRLLKKWTRLFFCSLGACGFLILSCQGSGVITSSFRPLKLVSSNLNSLLSEEPNIFRIGEPVQLRLVAIDKMQQDIPVKANFYLLDPSVGQINQEGILIASRTGEIDIIAKIGPIVEQFAITLKTDHPLPSVTPIPSTTPLNLTSGPIASILPSASISETPNSTAIVSATPKPTPKPTPTATLQSDPSVTPSGQVSTAFGGSGDGDNNNAVGGGAATPTPAPTPDPNKIYGRIGNQ